MTNERPQIPAQRPQRLDGKAWNAESVKWVEENGRLVSAFQERVVDALERQAAAFLNLLLAGAGGSLAYAVNLAEKQAAPWQQWGMAAVAIWLFAVAAVVLWRAMWSREIYGPGNDPDNLRAAYELDEIQARVWALEHHQVGISANRARNDAVGRALNQCRFLAALTPVIFGMAAWAAC